MLQLRVNAWNVSYATLYGGQFTLSTQLIILTYPVTLPHWHSTIVSLEASPPPSIQFILRPACYHQCHCICSIKFIINWESVCPSLQTNHYIQFQTKTQMNDLMDGLIHDMATGTYTTKRPYPVARFVMFSL